MLKTNLTTALACALLTIATPGSAQEKFPTKPIRMLVPFSAGSTTDFVARLLGQKMTERSGQQVVVDNRPSAGGIIASETLLAAPPDGYTLMLVSIGHAVNASLYSKLPYDTVRDFAGITLVTDTPTVLVVTPSLGLKTVKDLVDYAKADGLKRIEGFVLRENAKMLKMCRETGFHLTPDPEDARIVRTSLDLADSAL